MIRRLLFIHHSGGLGGAPRSLSYLFRGLNRNEFNPFLINIDDGPANDLFKRSGVNPKILKHAQPFHGSTVVTPTFKLTLKNWILLLPTIWIAYNHLKKIKPDIIHLNSTCLFAFAIAAKLWNSKVPVICHVREPIRKGYGGWPLRFFSKRFVDGFIAISQYDLDSLNIPTENKTIKRTIIHNFVDNDAIKNSTGNKELFKKLGVNDKDVAFLYLARFAEGNGWKLLINMAQDVCKKFPNFHFVLAGAPEEKDFSMLETHNIHILSFQKNVEPLLHTSDVFVCPFTEPHFARGIIEASAAGLPIIASNVGGVNELVLHNQTGFLYCSSSEFEMYASKLGNDLELRKEMGRNGKKLVSKKFEHDKNIGLTYNFFKLVIKDK